MQNDEFYLHRCIELAEKGLGMTSPNPMVGCVIVHNEEIIGEGYHKEYGKEHAEVNAINNVKNKSRLKESTLFVNLEPCCHYGKTPPCVDLIIEHKIPKVIIGCIDSFQKVNGSGIKKLKKEGINVITHLLNQESRILNKRFFTFHEKNRPYIILKWAQSKDHFIAPKYQKGPFWMTNNEAKKLSHQWRAEEDAIMIGRITAEKDNPLLTAREVKGKNPLRIVIDRQLKLTDELNIFNNDSDTIIINELENKKNNTNTFIKIDFDSLILELLKILKSQKIQSLIIEGGTKTIQEFIDLELWDEARVFTTNKTLSEGTLSPNINGKLLYQNNIADNNLKILVPRI